jgi:putative membrane protein
MRLIFLILALACVAVGLFFGALNPLPMRIDFYWFAIDASTGVALLGSALLGAACGGVAVVVGVVWPLQSRLRKVRRAPPPAAPVPEAGSPLALRSEAS